MSVGALSRRSGRMSVGALSRRSGRMSVGALSRRSGRMSVGALSRRSGRGAVFEKPAGCGEFRKVDFADGRSISSKTLPPVEIPENEIS